LQNSFKSESDLLKVKLEEDQIALQEGYELKGIDEAEYRAQQLLLAERYENDLAKIKQKGLSKIEKFQALSYKNQAKQVLSNSLKAYPMPLAGIMAAAHLTAGLAQVSK